ncbi:MAG: mechanosensitive ion channel [Thermohalobaculum sp.]|nr:mechanosensitive ion channel [Thermohalobaculum sp.]
MALKPGARRRAPRPFGLAGVIGAWLAVCLLGLAPFGSARAQAPDAPLPADGVARIVEAARDAGVPVVIIGAAALPAAGPAAPPTRAPIADRAAGFSRVIVGNFERDLADLAALPQTLPILVAGLSPDGDAGWVRGALGIAALAVLAGVAIERGVTAWLVPVLLGGPPARDGARTARIRYVLLRAAIWALALALGFGLGLLAAVFAVRHLPAHETVVLSVFEAVVSIRLALLFFRALLAPYEPAARLVAVPDPLARLTYRQFRLGAIVVGIIAAAAYWLIRIDAPAGVSDLATSAATMLGAVLLGRLVWRLRPPRADRRAGIAAFSMARSWHLVVIAYLAAAVLTTVFGRLAGLPIHGLVIAPVFGAVLAAVLYSAALLAVDRAFGSSAEGADPAIPSFRAWGERAALVVVIGIALGVVLDAWEVGIFNEAGKVRPVLTVLVMSGVAWIGWSAIRTAFDRCLAQERHAHAATSEDRDEADEGGAGGTRLATILPLFRNAILITILVVAGMVVLSSMGIDVAPLFAGAGLVGIAVGFGAQTLVRDIFSGAFFLIDDAFRVGEYIDTGGAKGTVEKISIRSMQLRHHTGPLHTIPFGEIHQLTNFSRDWVIMKLPIRVRFGTDTERVRKLVKKLGQELLADPVIGAKFVEPLKSQGVYKMDEYGIITRVKFKTKPGDQFAVRKVVYQRMNELFESEGIAFGGREVVVRASGEGEAGTGRGAAALAAAAAAAEAASEAPAPR